MSPSDRGTAEPPGATMPTEQIPRIDDRSDRDPVTGPIELPEIVPATTEDGDPVQDEHRANPPDRSGARADEPSDPAADPLDAGWVRSDSPPVVVPTATSLASRSARAPRVRRVTRVVRHVDPWSVFKVALICSAVLYGVLLTAGVLLWNVASSTGTVDNVERWFTQFGWDTFELNGGEIYHNAWIAGLFGVVALTGLAVLMATVFNLVSDLVGGVRVTILEEEVVERSTTGPRR